MTRTIRRSLDLRRIDLAKAPPRLPQTSGEELKLSERRGQWLCKGHAEIDTGRPRDPTGLGCSAAAGCRNITPMGAYSKIVCVTAKLSIRAESLQCSETCVTSISPRVCVSCA